MQWIKFYTGKWLYGSGRTMTPEKRGVWADLMALCGETKLRDGTLRFDVDRPMPRDYIANILQIDRQLFDVCLIAYQADINTDDGQPRVKIWDDGTIELTNFQKYQSPAEGGQKKKDKLSPRQRMALDLATTYKMLDQHPELAGMSAKEAIDLLIKYNTGQGGLTDD